MADITYKAEPTASLFHRSSAFVRALRGPIGTGKSVSCCMEIIRRGAEQVVYQGFRRSRWAVIRNTYPELKSTTIKTWADWTGDEKAPINFGSPITSLFTKKLKDGSVVEIEVIFLSLDRPADVKKIKGIDLTGVWLNEASELPKAVLDMATGRVGRYPSMAMGGSNWSGIIMDTNSPDDDHWYYDLAEITKPDGYEFFSQPGALVKANGKYLPNPKAENIQNHQFGYDYWLRQISGKDDQWIKVFILGEYGSIHDGKPVYPEYNDGIHCKEISPVQGQRLTIGLDFGLTPAAVITQVDARGRLLVLDEICSEDMAVRGFLEDMLIPFLMREYPTWWAKKDSMILCVGDPAGQQRSQTDERSCFDEVRAKGIKIISAKTNAWLPRRGAVVWYMSKLSGGHPAFLIDPYCKVLRKGLNGGYKYRRIQVTGDERYTESPAKNAYSHPHDALQYAALESGGIQAINQNLKPALPQVRPFRPSDPAMGGLG